MSINSDIQKLEPGAIVEVFEVDAEDIGAGTLRFHGYPQDKPVWWQGNRYEPWAIEASGFQRNGEGRQPAPTVRVGNIGVDEHGKPIAGVISAMCRMYGDLVGARFIRRRTLAKYLDAANFATTESLSGSMPASDVTIALSSQAGQLLGITRVNSLEMVDSLGRHELTTIERHNLVRDSSYVYRQSVELEHIKDYALAPTSEMATLIFGGRAKFSVSRLSASIPFLQGKVYTASVYLKPLSSDSPVIRLHVPNDTFGGAKQANLRANGFVFTANSPDDFGVQSLPGGWFRLWITAAAIATLSSADVRVIMDGPSEQANGWLVTGWQVEESAQPTKYIPTRGSVRYVRDYELNGENIALGDVPLAGSVLTYDVEASVVQGNSTADPTQAFPDEIWLIEQRTSSNAEVVEFELSSPLDFQGQQLPARQITTQCAWTRIGGYRGPYCGYTGSAMFDKNDKPVTDPALDVCAGFVSSCQIRLATVQGCLPIEAEIPFGGEPAADRLR